MPITVLVNGASGKMGQIACKAINSSKDFALVATNGREDDLASNIKASTPDLAIDFTIPDAVFNNCLTYVEHNVRPVIGTTGLHPEQIEALQKHCATKQLGGIIAPNFSISAILMMKYAKTAAKYFPDVEIIELHHPQKLDAPSGTALKTAEMIQQQRKQTRDTNNANQPNLPPARGFSCDGIQIHSVRLPGYFSNQTVIFANANERLVIRHEGINRDAMSAGIVTACREVMKLNQLIYGLEHIL